jgi:hypothetical protein
MARRCEMVARGGEGGPPAGWRLAARVVLVLALVQLVGAVLAGGHFWLGPWIVLPLFFFWTFGGPLGRRGRHPRRELEDAGWEEGWDDAPALDSRRAAAPTREEQLAAELAATRRRLRELEEQLRWQTRLLEAAPLPPAPRETAPPPA